MKIAAVVPLRGGSKSIPKKNIKPICGMPLCYYSIKAAIDSGVFSEIVISTDCTEIAKVVKNLFKESVKIIMRPPELATDSASTESVVMDLISRKALTLPIICLIQATSPLVKAKDFQMARDIFFEQDLDSLITGTPFTRFIWNKDGSPINYDPQNRPRRQEFQQQIQENGAFYLTKSSIYKEFKNRIGGKTGTYVMHPDTAIEIDEPEDWQKVESVLIKNKRYKSKIKAIILDVDGTLTDGKMHYGATGEFLKSFSTIDAMGIELARKKGIKVCIISGEDSPSVKSRAIKMGFTEENYFPGIKNKLPVLKKWLKKNNLDFNEVAYGGDDIGDLECMSNVGFAFCPNDANDEIKSRCLYISSRAGGNGAVRDFIDKFIY